MHSVLFPLAAIAIVSHSASARPFPEALQTPSSTRAALFQNMSQVDVVTVLLLLGEATIWKAIWGRFRSRRSHWTQWAFAISPGWTPLAASLFASMYGSLGPTNLVFDRPPEACVDAGLLLTNLNSGATHAARNTIVQNVWHTWNKGARRQISAQKLDHLFDLTREVGLADVNLDLLHLEAPALLCLQSVCLAAQLIGSFTFGLCGWSFEIFIALLVALLSQTFLLISIVPREKAWTKVTRGHRPCAVMLHRGLDSTEVLIIRTTWSSGRAISLEEFCWDNQASKDLVDKLKPLAAAVSFLMGITHVVLVGWMTPESRYLYLLFGGLGLLTNTIEAAAEPRWAAAFRCAFTHHTLCAPLHGSLMSAVALLLAGRFPGAEASASLLYPANARFQKSLRDLAALLDQVLCEPCRQSVRSPPAAEQRRESRCLGLGGSAGGGEARAPCLQGLGARIPTLDSKQLADGLAAVYNYLRALHSERDKLPLLETRESFKLGPRHSWEVA